MSMARNPKCFFSNLEKKRGVQSWIWKLIVEEKEITDHKEISKNVKAFYETLKRTSSKTNVEKQRFLNSLSTKTLTNEQYDLCKNKINETDLLDSMKSMKNSKTPGKEFYETFWDGLKTPLMERVDQAYGKCHQAHWKKRPR